MIPRRGKKNYLFIAFSFLFVLILYGYYSTRPKIRSTTSQGIKMYDEVGVLRNGSMLTFPFHGHLVNADGLFLARVKMFNKALSNVRNKIMSEQGVTYNTTHTKGVWTHDVLATGKELESVWGANDNYLELLANHHKHILTVALPWRHQPANNSSKWNSLTDFSNVLVQRYYEWTADEKLCTLVETRGAIKLRYDVTFNRSCERNQMLGASHPRSIAPFFLYAKPISDNRYWPNNSDSYPAFFANTPPFVFHIHIHQFAVADDQGDVFSGSSALLLYHCRSTKRQSSLPSNVLSLPIYNEVFTMTQMWGTAVFHRMVEVIPRIVFYIDFLLEHPDIRVQVPGSQGNPLTELLEILGVEKRRLVYGSVRGNIIYQPRPIGCGTANVQESQLTSTLFRNYITQKLFFDRNQTRNRLILIRRSGTRHFTEHQQIETQLKSLATEFGLIYELFADNPTPSLVDTMKLFNSAVLVVGPHGAGLSNIIFSEPGTFVVEGVCNVPHVNLCFQWLAHVLGHRWHGVTSRGGCEGVVDASAGSIIDAARTFLEVMTSSNETFS